MTFQHSELTKSKFKVIIEGRMKDLETIGSTVSVSIKKILSLSSSIVYIIILMTYIFIIDILKRLSSHFYDNSTSGYLLEILSSQH